MTANRSDARPPWQQASGSAAPRIGEALGQVVSFVTSPALLASVVICAAGMAEAGIYGLQRGLLVSAVLLGLPMLLIAVLTARGKVDSLAVRDRAKRIPIMAATVVLFAISLTLMTGSGAVLGIPSSIVLAALAVKLGVVCLLILTLKWKVSAHTAITGFFIVAMPAIAGGWLILLLWPLQPLVAWVRIQARHHNFWQTVVGTWVGVLIGAAFAAAWLVSFGA